MRSTYPSTRERGPRAYRSAAARFRGLSVAQPLHYVRLVRPQPLASDLTGTLVGGYRLERRLGGSASAQVYFGRHESSGAPPPSSS